MKKKSGTVSFAAMDKLIGKPAAPNVVSFSWEDNPEDVIEVEVKSFIPLDEMRQFIRDVTDNLFDEDGGYHPEVEAQAIALQTIRYYTNMKLDYDADGLVTPRMMARLGELLYGQCRAMSKIYEALNARQMCDIKAAIQKTVTYRQQLAAADHNAAYQQLIGRLDSATEVLGTFSAHMADVDQNQVLDVLRRFDSKDKTDFERAVINALPDRRMGMIE
ncbi:MAG: hypothetical protein PUF04_09415 [bacterium]|nr:hypothetical protein [bacterium]